MSIRAFRLPLSPLLLVLLTLAADVAAQSASSEMIRKRLIREIELATQNFDGAMGVAIRDLKGDDEILVNGGATYPTGSSIKIPILIELHRQVAAGSLKLTDTLPIDGRNQVGGSGVMLHFAPGSSQLSLHDLSVLMIALSDNSATNMLIDRLGMARINQTMSELGLTGIRLQRKMIDLAAMASGAENLATPREAARLMEMIARGTAVSPEVSAAVLKTLRIPKVSPIPRLLPTTVKVANKPGGLEGVASDWALVEVPNRPFTIAVMSTWNGEAAAADDVIAKIARLAYDYFARLARSTPYGARIPLGLIQPPK